MITAHRDAILIIRSVIRTVHPCSPPGNTAIPDQLQAGGEDLPVPVKEFLRDMEVFIICEEIPHIIDAYSLMKSPFGSSLIDRNIITGIQISHITDRGDTL